MIKYKDKLNKSTIPSNIEVQNLLQDFQTSKFDIAEKSPLSMTKKFPKHEFGWKVLEALLIKITLKINLNLKQLRSFI